MKKMLSRQMHHIKILPLNTILQNTHKPYHSKGEKVIHYVPDEKSKPVIFWLEHEVKNV